MAAAPALATPPPAHETSLVTVTIWRPAPGVFLTRVKGRLDLPGAKAIESAFRRQVLEEKHHIGFHDWEEMTNYDGPARALLTDVARELLPAVRAAHLLVGSAIVAFGVRAANIVLRRLTVEDSRATFDRALAGAIVDARPALSEIRRRSV